MATNTEYVLRTARQRGVTFIRLWWADVRGTIKGIAFPVSELEAIIDDGIGADGASLAGVRGPEIDLVARPDVSGFQVLPWREQVNVARMFADLTLPSGAPFPGDPRHVLRGLTARAADRGLTLHTGAELEFHLLKDATLPPQPIEGGEYFELTPGDIATDFRKQTIEFLEHLGIPVRSSFHEAGPAQQEVVLQHADALTSADAILTFRMAVKQAATNLGMHATFMPKPFAGQTGSALHLHCSMFDDAGRNAFHSDDRGHVLSPLGEAFTAGLLAHAGELTAVGCQWANSYKRLAAGEGAPTVADWSRTAPAPFIRVPGRRPGRDAAARIELRIADAASNPYLLHALILAAGLDGIERELPLPPEGEPAAGALLPRDLAAAADLLDGSAWVREAIGEELTGWLVAAQRREAAEHATQITDAELRHGIASL